MKKCESRVYSHAVHLPTPKSSREGCCTCLLISSASTMGEGPSHACAARYSISAEWSLFDVLLMRICVDASWASVALNVSASACQGICTGLNISRRAGQRGAKRIFRIGPSQCACECAKNIFSYGNLRNVSKKARLKTSHIVHHGRI